MPPTPVETTAPTEAAAVAAIARRSVEPQRIGEQPLECPLLVFPASEKIQSLEPYLQKPLRKRAVVKVYDHQSLINYVKPHNGPGTVIFMQVDEKGGSFRAVIDHHDSLPGWREHVCVYQCEHTPEWKRWMKNSGELLGQAQMALFIEDNLFDIMEPAAAAMLELVKTLEATQGVQFRSAIRLDNGDRQLLYDHTTQAKAGQKGDMEVPSRFTLHLQVFVNGPFYEVDCRFRYRIDGGDLVMGYEIERPHKIIELAMADSRNAIEVGLGLPVLHGETN